MAFTLCEHSCSVGNIMNDLCMKIICPDFVIIYVTVKLLVMNQATGYATCRTWCLFQARINWEGCDRKGIWRTNGGDDGGRGTDCVASSWIVGASTSVIFPLHHPRVGDCLFWYQLTRLVLYKGPLNGCVCVCMHVCVRVCMRASVHACVSVCACYVLCFVLKYVHTAFGSTHTHLLCVFLYWSVMLVIAIALLLTESCSRSQHSVCVVSAQAI